MQRVVCLIALFTISFAANTLAAPVTCDKPFVTIQDRPWENGTFSHAGVIRFIRGTCTDDKGNVNTANLDNTKFTLQERNVYTGEYETVPQTDDESLLQWPAIEAVHSLYTFILIDVSGTQTKSLSDVSGVLTNTLKPALAKTHGQTQVAFFDGSSMYYVEKEKKWYDKTDDAIQQTTDKLKDWKILDNSTNLWGALAIANRTVVDRLNLVSTYNSSNYEQEYANGLIIVISNFRDTCGCAKREPVNDPRIQVFPMAIGDNFDNNTYTSWYTLATPASFGVPATPGVKLAGAVNLNDIKEQATRNTYVNNQFASLNSSIADDSKGFIAMRFCSPRRGYPKADNTTLFQMRILYNGNQISVNSPNNYYNASTFLPGCTLSSAVTMNIFAGLIFFALFFVAF